MSVRIQVLLALVGILFNLGVQAAEADLDQRLRARLVNSTPGAVASAGGQRLHATVALKRFYLERLYQPVWVSGAELSRAGRDLLAVLDSATTHGLRAEDYHLDAIARLTAQPLSQPGQAVDTELLLADGALLFASHLVAGRVNPASIDAEWFAEMRGTDVVAALSAALGEGRLVAAYEQLAPQDARYQRLRTALAQWRERATAPAVAPIPDGSWLELGQQGAAVAALRQRLGLAPEPAIFDEHTAQAVRAFQADYGLNVDAVVGPQTRQMLNQTPQQVIERLEVNMERWRWMPQALAARRVEVNIPAFELVAFDAPGEALRMRVIVGREYRRTPVFSERIRYLVMNPYWEAPHKIVVNDLLPKFQADPGLAERMGFEVLSGWGEQHKQVPLNQVDWRRYSPKTFGYRLRQRPGPSNALGRVKFMFPNDFAVYLHDTSAPELFAQARRTLSSGCVRVEKPRDLAAWLTGTDAAWPASALQPVDKVVPLAKPVPVHLQYWTAWVDEGGRLHQRADVYERDARVLRALREPAPN